MNKVLIPILFAIVFAIAVVSALEVCGVIGAPTPNTIERFIDERDACRAENEILRELLNEAVVEDNREWFEKVLTE